MKKRILILAAALLCLLSTGVLAAGGTSQTVDLWDGTVSMPASIVSQDGEQYYEISSCSELAYVAQMGGSWLKSKAPSPAKKWKRNCVYPKRLQFSFFGKW